jgi:hypothetical protein
MSGTFKPCTSSLPRAQQQLWPQLSATVAMGFVLYGGTAIALGIGHRPCVDFDDGDLRTLTKEDKSILVNAVSAVRELPRVAILFSRLSG